MRFSLRTAVSCLGLACALALSPVILRARRHDNQQDLTRSIQRERNPVKKAKLEVRMGKLMLDEAVQAYDHHQMPQGKELLSSYTAEMQDAWRLLQSTGRNAAKKPDGFMQLEIALRQNRRVIKQLRERVYYLYRGPIDETLKTLHQIHAQVLVELFPGAAPPSAAKPAPAKVSAYESVKGGASRGIHP